MGTENTNDDVIILADAYDTTEHFKMDILFGVWIDSSIYGNILIYLFM